MLTLRVPLEPPDHRLSCKEAHEIAYVTLHASMQK